MGTKEMMLAELEEELKSYPFFLTVDELSGVLPYSKNYLRKIFKSGRLPGIKVAGRWAISRPHLVRWVGGGVREAMSSADQSASDLSTHHGVTRLPYSARNIGEKENQGAECDLTGRRTRQDVVDLEWELAQQRYRDASMRWEG